MRNSIVNHLEVLAAKDSDIMLLVGITAANQVQKLKHQKEV